MYDVLQKKKTKKLYFSARRTLTDCVIRLLVVKFRSVTEGERRSDVYHRIRTCNASYIYYDVQRYALHRTNSISHDG